LIRDVPRTIVASIAAGSEKWSEQMGKLAIVATIKTVPGKREEYLKHLKAHAQRCLATEPPTLTFEILVPKEEADTVMAYEVYASWEAFDAHCGNGLYKQQAIRDWEGLEVMASSVFCDCHRLKRRSAARGRI
jgi:quinol monooxygenase YgiN